MVQAGQRPQQPLHCLSGLFLTRGRCAACCAHQWAALSGEFCHRRQRDPQKAALFPSGASGKGADRASAGCNSAGCSWHPPGPSSQGSTCWQRGTGSATGGSRACAWIKTPPHSTGTPTELPLSLVAPRESPERLCPDRALLRLCCRAERGTASTATSTSMVTPSLQTDAGLRAAAPGDTTAQHSGSRAGCLEGMCFSPTQHSHPAYLSEVSWPSLSMLPARATVLADWLSCSGHAGPGRALRLLLGREAAGSGAPSSPALGLGSTDHSSFTGDRAHCSYGLLSAGAGRAQARACQLCGTHV